MERKIIITATLFGAVAIILGAFGAHALKKVLTVEELVSFETGVRYQMYHAFFLFFIGTTGLLTEKSKETILYLTIAGVFFFSGSIYLLATRSISGINFKFLGPVTPLGGLLLISAWGVLLLNVFNKRA
jgi:uncharacterized membrane protein YgdD (TMEM256/DUF423 family)